MKCLFPILTWLPTLLLLLPLPLPAAPGEGTAGAELLFEAQPDSRKAAAADADASHGLAQELSLLTEALAFRAMANFNQPGGGPAAEAGPQGFAHNEKDAAPGRIGIEDLDAMLNGVAEEIDLVQGEKITGLRVEIVLPRNMKLTAPVEPARIYHDLRESLNDKTSGPLTDEDTADLVSMIGNFLPPPRIRSGSNNLAAGDYCFKARLETSDRSLRLTLIKHGGKYAWVLDNE